VAWLRNWLHLRLERLEKATQNISKNSRYPGRCLNRYPQTTVASVTAPLSLTYGLPCSFLLFVINGYTITSLECRIPDCRCLFLLIMIEIKPYNSMIYATKYLPLSDKSHKRKVILNWCVKWYDGISIVIGDSTYGQWHSIKEGCVTIWLVALHKNTPYFEHLGHP